MKTSNINKCKTNKDLMKSSKNILHKTKTIVSKKISMNSFKNDSTILTNGNNDNRFFTNYKSFCNENYYNNILNKNNINEDNINNNNNINNDNNNINNNNNNNNNNNENESFDEEFKSIFEMDIDESYNKRLEEVHKLYNYDDGGILSENHNEIIFLGIIDILTEYNCKKSTEHFFKMIRYCSNNMSCVNPIYYKDRFFNYMKNVILFGDPNVKLKNNKLFYQETTTDNENKNNFIINDNNNDNIDENDEDNDNINNTLD